ncbi:peptidoglycan recognition protein family protein [Cumulibacter soli]|uniref:peptidoglycan recognition protein family protein n=1 Tax=Cumulibacter soli TaxID=2546344 RepID=UPI0010689194|nr:N-acetylmuramoyl-L-alanine amidase [Cumulibacter soli]
MPYQLGLPNALMRFGLTVEVVDGWGTRGWSGLNPRGSVSHWTASPGGPRPSLGICIYGRPDLDGPLCNVFLDRAGVAIVVAAGMANHAGPGGYNGMSGNDSVFGTECEGTIGNRDGTDFTDAQRAAYPKVVAAYHYLTKTSPLTHACGHSEWTNQKIDVGTYAPTLRRQAAAILAGGAIQEDDMTPGQAKQLADIHERLAKLDKLAFNVNGGSGAEGLREVIGKMRTSTLSISKGVATLVGRDPHVIDAKAIAESIPDDIAAQVADELAKRLKS